jgi:hypothetical protein
MRQIRVSSGKNFSTRHTIPPIGVPSGFPCERALKGVTLDARQKRLRGIIPTAAAHELARSSGPHIDALELLGETAQISDYEGTVHLGGPIEFLTERVFPSLSQLIRNGLGFRVTVASPDKLIDQLSKHTIDHLATYLRGGRKSGSDSRRCRKGAAKI